MLLFLLGLFDVLAPLEDRFCEETNHSMVMGTPLRKFQTQILSRLVACNHFINREFVLNKRKKKKTYICIHHIHMMKICLQHSPLLLSLLFTLK